MIEYVQKQIGGFVIGAFVAGLIAIGIISAGGGSSTDQSGSTTTTTTTTVQTSVNPTPIVPKAPSDAQISCSVPGAPTGLWVESQRSIAHADGLVTDPGGGWFGYVTCDRSDKKYILQRVLGKGDTVRTYGGNGSASVQLTDDAQIKRVLLGGD